MSSGIHIHHFYQQVSSNLPSLFGVSILFRRKLLADKQNQILINISISLMFLYFTFLIGGFTVGVPPLCGVMSALLQYFFLVFFSWSAVEAVWLYLKLVVVMGSQSLTSKFMLKAGIPAWCKLSLIIIMCVLFIMRDFLCIIILIS